MQEGIVTAPEATAIILKRRRRHGRILEPGMAFDVGGLSLVNIAPRSRKSIVKPLLSDCRKIWRRRWFGIYRVGMRTSCQCEGQQQRRHNKPFLHVVSSIVLSRMTSRQYTGSRRCRY
jgi:hypothetical protein